MYRPYCRADRRHLQVLELVLQLRGEGPVAHARRIGLHDADDGVDLLRRHTQTRAHATHRGIRGGHLGELMALKPLLDLILYINMIAYNIDKLVKIIS